jgi:hypothetical protein
MEGAMDDILGGSTDDATTGNGGNAGGNGAGNGAKSGNGGMNAGPGRSFGNGPRG